MGIDFFPKNLVNKKSDKTQKIKHIPLELLTTICTSKEFWKNITPSNGSSPCVHLRLNVWFATWLSNLCFSGQFESNNSQSTLQFVQCESDNAHKLFRPFNLRHFLSRKDVRTIFERSKNGLLFHENSRNRHLSFSRSV